MTLGALALGLLWPTLAHAQNELVLTFRGKYYLTNSTGYVVQIPVTEKTLMLEAAQAGGTSDISNMSLVYHVAGSSLGDTVDVVNRSTGATLTSILGFFFGDNTVQDVGHVAVTNSTGTEVRRIDQLFALYGGSFQSGQSLGGASVTKRFQQDLQGNHHDTVEVDVNYLAIRGATNNVHMVVGTFTSARPFIPGQ